MKRKLNSKGQISAEMIIILVAVIALVILLTGNLQKFATEKVATIDKKMDKLDNVINSIDKEIDDPGTAKTLWKINYDVKEL